MDSSEQNETPLCCVPDCKENVYISPENTSSLQVLFFLFSFLVDNVNWTKKAILNLLTFLSRVISIFTFSALISLSFGFCLFIDVANYINYFSFPENLVGVTLRCFWCTYEIGHHFSLLILCFSGWDSTALFVSYSILKIFPLFLFSGRFL